VNLPLSTISALQHATPLNFNLVRPPPQYHNAQPHSCSFMYQFEKACNIIAATSCYDKVHDIAVIIVDRVWAAYMCQFSCICCWVTCKCRKCLHIKADGWSIRELLSMAGSVLTAFGTNEGVSTGGKPQTATTPCIRLLTVMVMVPGSA
jgi:hypothetical protein